MITAIVDGRAVDRIAHRITDVEAAAVTKVLAALGVPVEITEPDGLGVVHLWAKKPCGTAGEVLALRGVTAVYDGPLAFHEAVATC